MLFVPRQVVLASLPAAAAAAAAMAKEEPRKEKKCKSKSTAAANGSAATDARRVAVVASVAAFLEASGFPRTLAALQSEANLEGDAWRSSPVSLEDLVSKFLDSSSSAPGAVTAVSDEQEKPADAVVEEEDASKKKKKKKGGAEAHEPKSKASQQSAPEKPSENADDKTKEKKRKKKKDSSSSGNDDGAKENEMVKSDDQKLDGKKKKNKKQENDEDVEARLEKVELAVKDKFEAAGKLKDDSKKSREEEPKSQNDGADKNGLGDDAPLDKGKKKKKSKSTSETSDKIDAGIAPADNAVVSKKRKLEEVEGNTLPAKEDSTANQKVNNGFTEDDTKEHNTASKPNKRQKLSSEPKTVIAFQRVKLDDVKFADDRLQDNSYWAKGGADSGYGAKAQEILGQVRGRGFRHEKTKKKRGTYRGGLIDLQTHSIKFNNSDDE